MWNKSLIVGPLHIPAERDSAGNVIAWQPGYHLLVGDAVVTPEVADFVAQYSEAPLVFAGVVPTYLTFADEAEARATIPAYWQTAAVDPASTYHPVPATVTNRQLRLALIDAGQFPMIDAYVKTAELSVKTEWDYANTFDRSNPLINSAATGLGMTTEQIDDLFRLAATL